jgi:purine nucleoside permease
MPDLLSHNISVPGLCPLFPEVHCTPQGQVCQLTCCEGEINAASSLSALIYSRMFTLTHTYFLIAGVAGINPHIATTGSVTFSKYAVQFDLQYEFDSRQIPSNDSYGYFPQNSFFPDSPAGINYPGEIYGTEVFALNNNLKEKAIYLASQAKLNDTTGAAAYRKKYPYKPANQPPKVLACDTGTSNVYWSGSILGDAFSAYTKLLTNGSGTYCATQQEDNAICEVLLRGDLAGVVDFSRLMIMRTASDFDRAPPSEDEVYHLLHADQEGFLPSIDNIYIAGSEIVKDILKNWDGTWKGGIAPGGYIGDAFNSLKGKYPPDIGTEAIYIN